MHKIKRLLRKLLGVPLTIVSLLFIANFIYSNRFEVIYNFKNFNLLGGSVGFLFLGLFFALRSFSWRELLVHEGYPLPVKTSIYLLSISELKRYIPGVVLGFVSRIDNFNKQKIPGGKVIRMIAYENIIFILTSFPITIPGLIFIADRNNIPRLFPYLIFLLTLTIFFIFFFSNKYSLKIKQSFKYLNVALIMTAAWISFGLGTYLVLSSFYLLDPTKIIKIVSLIILSWLIGYIVVIVPLGLGIREAFMTYALSFFSPLGIAAAAAVIARIAVTIAELIFLVISYALYKTIITLPKFKMTTIILFLAIISYISYFTYYSFEKYNNFFNGRFDLGNMDQTVWNTLHGRIFQLTNPNGIETVSRLAFHSDFILILLVPFYFLWKDPRMLLLIQTIVIAAGAYFVYKIAELVLKNRYISLLFALSYLLNPFIEKQNLFDFHAVTLATTFLLATFYYILRKKYYYMLSFLTLAVLCKEEIFAIAGLLFLFVLYKTRNIKWILGSIVSFVLFYLMIAKFIPEASGGQHFATAYFQDFGDSPSKIIVNLALNPFKTRGVILNVSNLSYIFKLLLPMGFVSLASPFYLILSAPDLVINLLSKNENLKSLTFHYAATIIPFIYISGIYGVKNLLAFKSKIINIRNLTFFILISMLAATYLYGALPGSLNPSLEIFTDPVRERETIDSFLKRIPSRLSVAASNNIGSHLSHRQNIYTIPFGIDKADIVALLLDDNFAQPSLKFQKELASKLKYDNNYVLLYEYGDFIVFAKKKSAIYLRRKV